MWYSLLDGEYILLQLFWLQLMTSLIVLNRPLVISSLVRYVSC